MKAVIAKDLKLFFASPIAAVAISLFILMTSFAFTSQVTQVTPGQLPEASMRGLIYFSAVIFLFISPFLTMRSFAEEARAQTLELLRTAPISDTSIVLGKFLAAWLFFSVMIIATWIYPATMLFYGTPDLGPLLMSYVGLWFLGGAFLSVGIFTSSLVRSPMLASLLSFVILLMLWFMGAVPSEPMQELSLIKHLESFSTGVLDVSDMAFYILFIGAFVFLTIRYQEAQRWK